LPAKNFFADKEFEINSSMENYSDDKKSRNENFIVEVLLTIFFTASIAFTFFVIFRN